MLGDVYYTFLSLDSIGRAISDGIDRLFNSQTGQRYGGNVAGGVDVPDIDAGSAATPRANLCAACFTCQVAELRAVFLLVGTIWGCALDGERYPGRVEGACLEGDGLRRHLRPARSDHGPPDNCGVAQHVHRAPQVSARDGAELRGTL